MNQTKSPATIIVTAAVVVIVIIIGALYYVQGGSTRSTMTQEQELAQQKGAEFVQNVAQVAEKTTSIDISDCTPDPQQAHFKMGANVRFVNNSDVPHTISFSPDHTFVVGKSSRKYVVFDFWKFPGVRKYSCDTNSSVGVVYVTNE
ncbi:MAG TPA: hypothetical protein VF438_00995 [Candidatus Paceibacterota bacterium]